MEVLIRIKTKDGVIERKAKLYEDLAPKTVKAIVETLPISGIVNSGATKFTSKPTLKSISKRTRKMSSSWVISHTGFPAGLYAYSSAKLRSAMMLSVRQVR